MSQTMPRLAAPVERTIPGAAATPTTGLDQSGTEWVIPFAGEGDE
jgi:hypothetical protein